MGLGSVQLDNPSPAQMSGDAAEQGGFTRRVSPHQCRQRAALKAGRGTGKDLATPIACPDVVQRQTYYDLRPFVRIRAAKKGTPTRAVMMPMGSTAPGRIALDSTDVADKITAPDSIAPGRKNR